MVRFGAFCCNGVCSNAIRNDLQHPNEYVRGSTLRTLCKLREPEILEPLVPSIRACLVRRSPWHNHRGRGGHAAAH